MPFQGQPIQLADLGHRLLHIVLAKRLLSGRRGFGHGRRGKGLGHGQQAYAASGTAGLRLGSRNTRAHLLQARGDGIGIGGVHGA